jgi:hypothetical protein
MKFFWDNDNLREKKRNKILKWILIAVGTIFLGFGIIGIFLPILPTTPFLLLAATCYARGSDRFYNWLIKNRVFGSYIDNYRRGKGIPMKVKIISIFLLWITILLSAILFIDTIWIKILLILIAIGVTIHLLTIRTFEGKIR